MAAKLGNANMVEKMIERAIKSLQANQVEIKRINELTTQLIAIKIRVKKRVNQ
jgi:pre-mRNA-processing factor 6